MNREEPLVSVLMTAYNREQYIAEAIESVINSTCQNWELIIVDDGSTDNTVEIAKSFAEKDNRIKFYRNKKKLGDYPNRNKAASYAKGEFIMFCDSDDKLLNDGIENCVNTMQNFPNSNFGICFLAEKSQDAYILSSEEALIKHFKIQPYLMVGPGGTIQRRTFFEKVNKYPEKYGPANDMYYNLKATTFSPVVILPFEFMFYRRHAGQEINNHFSYLYNSYNYLNDAILELPLQISSNLKNWISKKNKRRFFVNLLKYFFRTFNFRQLIYALKKTRFSFKDILISIFQFRKIPN